VYFNRHKSLTMKHIFYTAFVFCFATLSSCEEKEASGPGTMTTKPISLPALTPSATPAKTAPAAGGNIVTTTAPAKLNPAHGQPGHRCDISVGAPLPDGPAQSVKAATPNPTLINSPVQAAPAAIKTTEATPVAAVPAITPGINPAHGQPGHRCDVAVGATIPKTAAPAKTTTTNSPVISPVSQNTPLIQPQAATPTPVAANGLNPAHGQPGHRCDIAVGKPLSSAPKKN
jgi:hypothetical protein